MCDDIFGESNYEKTDYIKVRYLEKTLKSDRLQEIADYFNVSTDYLLGRTDNPAIAGEKAPEHEIELDDLDGRIMLFDGKPLSDDDKRAIKGIIEGFMNSKRDK